MKFIFIIALIFSPPFATAQNTDTPWINGPIPNNNYFTTNPQFQWNSDGDATKMVQELLKRQNNGNEYNFLFNDDFQKVEISQKTANTIEGLCAQQGERELSNNLQFEQQFYILCESFGLDKVKATMKINLVD